MQSGTTVRQFEEALQAFEATQQAASLQWPRIFDAFTTAFGQARAERAKFTPRLNLLGVFGLNTRELRHSRALQWFLDQGETHEQGSLFMAALLSLCRSDVAAPPDYRVQREKPDRVDVAAFKERSFAVFIENKVEHDERPNQFADLQNSLVRFCSVNNIPIKSRFALFLTDDGRAPTTAAETTPAGLLERNVCSISRVTVFDAFRVALQGKSDQEKSSLLSALLDSYAMSIKKLRGALK